MRRISGLPRRVIAAALATALIASVATAYAASGGNRGTITVCVGHQGGGLYRARHCGRRDSKLTWNIRGLNGQPGDQGQQGARGAPGPAGPGAEWALVQGSDGSVLEQSGGITVHRVFGGFYFVAFPADTAGKLISATPQWGNPSADRTVQVVRCGGSGGSGPDIVCNPPATYNDTFHVYVETWVGGSHADANYYISVIG